MNSSRLKTDSLNLNPNRGTADFNQYLSQSIPRRALAGDTLPGMGDAKLFLCP